MEGDDEWNEDFSETFQNYGNDNCWNRKRVILHFDIDCFYAQVEMLKDPTLKTKPLGIKQKNIVVTCNYVARKQGVKKCAYIRDAMKICPELVLVNGEDLAEYRKVSRQIFELICQAGNQKCPVERLGMDENWMDVSQLVDEMIETMKPEETEFELQGFQYGSITGSKNCSSQSSDICLCHKRLIFGSQIAQRIRQKLFDELGITSSCGIAHNKLLAKIGGSTHKPNKQTVIFHEARQELMLSLNSLRQIPSLGSTTADLMSKKGVNTIQELQEAKPSDIDNITDAKRLIDLAFGIDETPVKMSGKPLSIGLEDRFKCISAKSECFEKVDILVQRLAKLVLEDGRKPTTLKVFIRDYEKDKHDPSRKFCKQSRQGKINPSCFQDENSISKISPQIMNLISKIVDFDKFFHLTLIGISVTDFQQSVSSESKGLKAFFNVAASKSTENAEEKSKNLMKSNKRTLEDKSDEDFLDKTKRQKLPNDTELKNLGWDPQVFQDLPSELQKELINNSSEKMKMEKSDNIIIPEDNQEDSANDEIGFTKNELKDRGWDPVVFQNLPSHLQTELLSTSQNNQKNLKTPKTSSKNNSILNYFSKK